MANFQESITGAFRHTVENARRDIVEGMKGTVEATKNDIINQVTGTVNNTKNEIVNTVRAGASNAVSAVVKGAMGSAASLMRGDVAGALDSVRNITTDVTDVFTKTGGNLGDIFGLGEGDSLLSPGGYSMSSQSPESLNALEGIISRPDPMMSFYWYAMLPTLDTGQGMVSLPWNFVEEATPSFRTYDMNSIYRDGRMKKFASAFSVDNLRLGFYMDVGNQSLNYLTGWQNCIQAPVTQQTMYDRTGMYRLPSRYQRPIYIYLLNPARESIAVLQYVECWPQNLDSLQLNSGAGSRLIQNVSFATGDVIVNILSAPGSLQQAIIESANPTQALSTLTRNFVTDATRQVSTATKQMVSGGIKKISSLF